LKDKIGITKQLPIECCAQSCTLYTKLELSLIEKSLLCQRIYG